MTDAEKRRVGECGQAKPSREDLAAGYRARANSPRSLHDEMDGVSQEADEFLGDTPEWT